MGQSSIFLRVSTNIYNENNDNVLNFNFDSNGFPFIKPHFTFDTLNIKDKKPDIKELYNLDKTNDIGILLYAMSIDKKDSWNPRQKYIYYLREENLPQEEGSKVLKKLPPNHFIQVDIANNKLRLVGTHIKKGSNCTEWIYY